MNNGNWKFWFAIIGALLTGTGMFWDLKVEFTKTQMEVEHIKQDVAFIKKMIEEKHYANNETFYQYTPREEIGVLVAQMNKAKRRMHK